MALWLSAKKMLELLVSKLHLKIQHLQSQPHLPGDNEFSGDQISKIHVFCWWKSQLIAHRVMGTGNCHASDTKWYLTFKISIKFTMIFTVIYIWVQFHCSESDSNYIFSLLALCFLEYKNIRDPLSLPSCEEYTNYVCSLLCYSCSTIYCYTSKEWNIIKPLI